jgi:hypothetical protein
MTLKFLKSRRDLGIFGPRISETKSDRDREFSRFSVRDLARLTWPISTKNNAAPTLTIVPKSV